MHLNIFVSSKCFLYCKGCYSFSREEKCEQIINTCKLIDFLKFAYNYGVKKVTICGGDPLTRPDIVNLLEKIKNIGFYISMDTVGSPILRDIEINGKVITKKIESRKLAKLVDIIGIPIDGSNNEIFNKFRETKSDIVNEQISICKELHKHGANICINTVVHKGNLDDAKELAKLMNKMDFIKIWQIFQFVPLGKFGILNRKLYEITDKQFLQFKSIITKEIYDVNKVQFKDSDSRDKSYMIIDNSGNAWVPSFKKNNEREIIGNITINDDWDKICSYLV